MYHKKTVISWNILVQERNLHILYIVVVSLYMVYVLEIVENNFMILFIEVNLI